MDVRGLGAEKTEAVGEESEGCGEEEGKRGVKEFHVDRGGVWSQCLVERI